MADWVEVSLKGSEAERKRADMYAELRLRQMRIGQIMGPSIWMEIENRINSDVTRHREFRGSEDPQITYVHMLAGFKCVTAEYPRVVMSFNSSDSMIASVKYDYGATFGAERSWVRHIEIKFDDRDNYYLMFDGKRFDSPKQIAAALLAPLADSNFVPPD
jgi:hypothetical protein